MPAKRPTQKAAMDALADWRVPVLDAFRLFERAYRRSNPPTRGFVLHTMGVCRWHGELNHMLDCWADDGGTYCAPRNN